MTARGRRDRKHHPECDLNPEIKAARTLGPQSGSENTVNADGSSDPD